LDKITNEPEFFHIKDSHPFYPSYTDFRVEVIKQITTLKETKAMPGLNRIIELDLETHLVEQAKEALRKLTT